MVNLKSRVLVIMGGNSREREISLSSGNACIRSLKKLGFKVKNFDPQKQNFNLINRNDVDIIFNALHGTEGEDGLAQSYFEYLRIPYTHSGVISSMNAMDKVVSKNLFFKNKILSPKYLVLNEKDLSEKKIKILFKKKGLSYPVVVKPISEGSSIDVEIIRNLKFLKKRLRLLFKKYDSLIVEKFIGGQEIQVAVINGKALGAIELKPKRKFYDYKAKYQKSAKTEHIMPAKIPLKKYNEVLKISEKVHSVFECRGVTRSDFKYQNGKFYILEINTQPGMTSLSLVPEIAAFNNIPFNSLVLELIKDASLNK